MPDETVALTEIELAIMRVFVEHKIFTKNEIVQVLKVLLEKNEK